MSASWVVFDLPHSSGPASTKSPSLLLSYTFGSGSYTIRLTDLTYIWQETLTRRAIIARSFEKNTSIDPSEEPAQLRIFLQKIESALQRQDGSTLELKLRDKISKSDTPKAMGNPVLEQAKIPSLELHISVPLPGGLKPLEWHVNLEHAAQDELTGMLIRPLLSAQHRQMSETQNLVELLAEKDAVIQRLLDKAEAQGLDLSVLFPSAVGKLGRKFTKARAQERVKGLEPFSVDAWRESIGNSYSEPDSAVLLREVFLKSNNLPVSAESHEIAVQDTVSGWWTSLDESVKLSNHGDTTLEHKPESIARKTTEQEDPDDDFQVQEDPPAGLAQKRPKESEDRSTSAYDHSDHSEHLTLHPDRDLPARIKNSSSKATATESDIKFTSRPTPPDPPLDTFDDSTADEHVDESVSVPDENESEAVVKQTPSPSPPRNRKGKIGRLGSRRAAHSRSPNASPPTSAHENDTISATDSGGEHPPTGHGKRKIGALRGRKGSKHEDVPADSPSSSETQAVEKSVKVKKKLGAIGIKRKHATEHGESQKEPDGVAKDGGKAVGTSRERRQESVAKTPPRRETSQERADEKRRRLKQELEDKARAPVKKKKKF